LHQSGRRSIQRENLGDSISIDIGADGEFHLVYFSDRDFPIVFTILETIGPHAVLSAGIQEIEMAIPIEIDRGQSSGAVWQNKRLRRAQPCGSAIHHKEI
jgi:hypothetical protein